MARSIWKGSISFGLVNIPVGLYAAETRNDISFKMLDKKTMSPIHYKRVAEEGGKEVPWEQTIRGYEFESGKYVVLSDADLKGAAPEATQTIDIVDFVDLDEISPLYFDKPYYLAPDKKGTKAYALLRETLRRTGKVGISKVVIRTREYLAAVVARGEVLTLELMRYAHELRDADDLDVPRGKQGVTDREIDMAERLVEGMVSAWDPGKYKDTYRNDVMKMIEKRVEAGELFYRGAYHDQMAMLGLVAEGLLRIYLLADNGRQVTLHYADPGDIVGAPALLLAGAQSAGDQARRPWQLLGGRKIHGEALRDTLLLRLSPGQFLRLVRTEVSVAWPLAMFLARRAVAAQQILSDDMFLPIQARVARHVIDLAVPQGEALVVSAGHQEIADAIGSVREVVSRAMGQMRDEGLITREGNQTVVTDVARLRAIASTG